MSSRGVTIFSVNHRGWSSVSIARNLSGAEALDAALRLGERATFDVEDLRLTLGKFSLRRGEPIAVDVSVYTGPAAAGSEEAARNSRFAVEVAARVREFVGGAAVVSRTGSSDRLTVRDVRTLEVAKLDRPFRQVAACVSIVLAAAGCRT